MINCKQDVASTEEGRLCSVTYEGNGEKVFLIGDSIRQGYCPYVGEYLGDSFEITYPKDNCRNTQYVLTSMKSWTKMFDDLNSVKAVCFNCGHWDVAHWNGDAESLTSEADYGKNIRRIIVQLKKIFPVAKIIFFTTAPVKSSALSKMPNPRSNEEIDRYNEIAVAVAQSEGVTVGDMNKIIAAFGEECYRDYCHLNEEYCKRVASYVADVIKSELNR